ncbi:UDP-glycosyltransferase 73C3-like isoform X1 [Camellia sinensis]|uniref:UDP-glycosyltransferase 73C3-like isoform X1 n=1 Tax=Camellia sinensis TaxID=4442 RepID=UPI0010360CC8|nr:UDP-glycosyltransferase 73C3-like isoform X1 [Camellia sinensis]
MALQNHHQLHFILVPFMAPGHFMPMIDLAKLLAQEGVTVTVVTTPVIASRFRPIIDRVIESGLPLRLLSLRFPSVEVGLLEGCETIDAVHSLDLMMKFFKGIDMLQQPFEQLFETLEPCPSCLIADKYIAWIGDTVRKFGIPRILFDGMNCLTLLCAHNLENFKDYENVSQSEPFELPGLPDRIELTKAQLAMFLNRSSPEWQDLRNRIKAAEAEAYGVVINSFEELEPRYVDEFRKVKGDKVWCVGPLSLCNKDNLDKAQRGNKADIDENQCLKWLDEQEPRSVVYACLGSITNLSLAQLIELGLGLEASKRPFVWVIRSGDKAAEIEKWVEEDGFEERTKGRGLLIRGWAPQILILSHLAVGAFLTHCGWNSTLEGVCASVPMITWPMFGEQFLNEKLAVQLLEIGVSVGVQTVGHRFAEDKCEKLVDREVVRAAVENVMSEGIGEETRRRARVFGEMAKKAMEEGGSSYLNMRLFIQDVIKLVSHKDSTQEGGAEGKIV